MEHSGLGSVMWVFGTRSSHFLYRKPRRAVAPHGVTSSPTLAPIRRGAGATARCVGARVRAAAPP